jgi:hypothetical protein
MKVLAVSGWKQNGKDTLCDYLMNKDTERVAFADPLKDRVAEEYGIHRTDLDEQDKKEQPILHLPVDPQDNFTRTIAHLLVREFRTEDGLTCSEFADHCNLGFRITKRGESGQKDEGELKKLYWTPRALAIFKGSGNRAVASNYWVQQAIQKINKSNAKLIVIPDLRFKSEVKQLKEAFGDKVTTIRVNRFDTSPSTDPSERDLDNYEFDYIINNKGTLQEFYDKIDAMLRVEFGIYP